MTESTNPSISWFWNKDDCQFSNCWIPAAFVRVKGQSRCLFKNTRDSAWIVYCVTVEVWHTRPLPPSTQASRHEAEVSCGCRRLPLGFLASCSGMRNKALGNRRKAVLFLREAPCGPGGKGLNVKSPAAGTCNPILPSSSFLNLSLKTRKPEGLQTLGLVLLVSVLCLESQVFPPEPRVFGGGSYFCACLSSPALLVLWVFTGFSRRAHPGLR